MAHLVDLKGECLLPLQLLGKNATALRWGSAVLFPGERVREAAALPSVEQGALLAGLGSVQPMPSALNRPLQLLIINS